MICPIVCSCSLYVAVAVVSAVVPHDDVVQLSRGLQPCLVLERGGVERLVFRAFSEGEFPAQSQIIRL